MLTAVLTWLFACLAVAACSGRPGASPVAGGPAEAPIEVRDVDDVAHRPLDFAAGDKRAAVFIFIAPECPISNGYSPEINRLAREYGPKGVAFYLVHPDRDVTAGRAKQHAADFGYACPVLMDPDHALARRAGATVTPEAAVFSPDGALAYRGRIDDLYFGFGRKRFAPSTRDLRDALDALLAGKPVAVAETKAVGCAIPE